MENSIEGGKQIGPIIGYIRVSSDKQTEDNRIPNSKVVSSQPADMSAIPSMASTTP